MVIAPARAWGTPCCVNDKLSVTWLSRARVGMKTLAQHAEAFGWHPRATLGMILSLCTQPGVRQD